MSEKLEVIEYLEVVITITDRKTLPPSLFRYLQDSYDTRCTLPIIEATQRGLERFLHDHHVCEDI